MVQPAGRPMVAAAGGQVEAANRAAAAGVRADSDGDHPDGGVLVLRYEVLRPQAGADGSLSAHVQSLSQRGSLGFVMTCPRLFINYKLKSVAHLPWRQMAYKFLNVIIDDLFAFVIKMPVLHRLSVFRDDLIFLIYLYQGWVYPVDKKRVNEFGFGGEDENQENKSSITSDTTTEDTRTVGDKETN